MLRPQSAEKNYCAGTYLVIGRVVRQRCSWLAYIFPLYVATALTILVMALVRGTPLFGYEAAIYGWCLLAIGPSIMGHGAFNYAVRYFRVALLGAVSLLEPVGSALIAYVIFDEVPGLLAFLGMLLVLVGVTFAMKPSGKG